jgi:hypothetical protein
MTKHDGRRAARPPAGGWRDGTHHHDDDPPHPRRDHSGQIGAVVGALISPSRSLEPIELTTLGTIHPLGRCAMHAADMVDRRILIRRTAATGHAMAGAADTPGPGGAGVAGRPRAIFPMLIRDNAPAQR